MKLGSASCIGVFKTTRPFKYGRSFFTTFAKSLWKKISQKIIIMNLRWYMYDVILSDALAVGDKKPNI